MPALAILVATLLRFRARACVALACLAAMLCLTTNASALERVQTKTRVWGFEFAHPLNICPNVLASPRTHPETRSRRLELASVSPHAARGAATFGPKSVGAAQRVWRTLQTGGNTVKSSMAKALNEALGCNVHAREWGRALEALKAERGLPNNFHGNVLEFVNARETASFRNL